MYRSSQSFGWPTYYLENESGPPDEHGLEAYGSFVALADKTAIVSAPGVGLDGYNGSATFLTRDSTQWIRSTAVQQNFGGVIGRIGPSYACTSEAIRGNVAAYRRREQNYRRRESAARRRLHLRMEWHELEIRDNTSRPRRQSGDLFGCSISLSQDAIVIGSPGMNAGSGGPLSSAMPAGDGSWKRASRLRTIRGKLLRDFSCDKQLQRRHRRSF